MMAYFFKEWREWAGYTQEQMAELMGFRQRVTISRIENDQRAWTSDFLKDFCYIVECQSIADPLVRKPDGKGQGRRSDSDIEKTKYLLTRARDIRRDLRETKAGKAEAHPAPDESDENDNESNVA